jgi:hypothetical protein
MMIKTMRLRGKMMERRRILQGGACVVVMSEGVIWMGK